MHTFTLPNGLRCAVLRRPDSAMATVNVLYNVGARDEDRSRTGMAHLFEHLMFGGSANVPSFDGELENAGGNSNAWTSNDFTNFYDVLPALNIETAFHLESDRMLALSFSEQSLRVQRSVVIEEFKQTCLNRPYGDMGHRLRALLYSERHPYSWPVIGLVPEHIASVTNDDVRRWFYSHYAPNNAILTVVAPQPESELEAMVAKWFGDIPRRHIAERKLAEPGFPVAPVSETVQMANVPQPRIIIAYPMECYGTQEYYAADILTDILSAGRASRCWNNLIQGPVQGLFASADASISASEHEGFLLLTATVDAAAGPEGVERARRMLTDQFTALATPGNISPHELERVLNNYEATFAFEGIAGREMAFRMAAAIYHGEEPDEVLARRREITTQILTETAARIASRPTATLIYTGVGSQV